MAYPIFLVIQGMQFFQELQIYFEISTVVSFLLEEVKITCWLMDLLICEFIHRNFDIIAALWFLLDYVNYLFIKQKGTQPGIDFQHHHKGIDTAE